jgi:hypothetical protein
MHIYPLIDLPEAGVRFIACELGKTTPDWIVGAFSAIGMSERAINWKYQSRQLQDLVTQRSLLKPDAPEVFALDTEILSASEQESKAWVPIQQVINTCRELLHLPVSDNDRIAAGEPVVPSS